jgi:hypothetical protein
VTAFITKIGEERTVTRVCTGNRYVNVGKGQYARPNLLPAGHAVLRVTQRFGFEYPVLEIGDLTWWDVSIDLDEASFVPAPTKLPWWRRLLFWRRSGLPVAKALKA